MKRALNLPSPLGQLIALLVLGVVAGLAGYLSVGDSSTATPPAAVDSPSITRGIVQSSTASSLTLTTPGGPRTFAVPSDATVEALRPIEVPAVRAGDWLNAGAVPNAQTLFALTGLIVIPENLVQAPNP